MNSWYDGYSGYGGMPWPAYGGASKPSPSSRALNKVVAGSPSLHDRLLQLAAVAAGDRTLAILGDLYSGAYGNLIQDALDKVLQANNINPGQMIAAKVTDAAGNPTGTLTTKGKEGWTEQSAAAWLMEMQELQKIYRDALIWGATLASEGGDAAAVAEIQAAAGTHLPPDQQTAVAQAITAGQQAKAAEDKKAQAQAKAQADAQAKAAAAAAAQAKAAAAQAQAPGAAATLAATDPALRQQLTQSQARIAAAVQSMGNGPLPSTLTPAERAIVQVAKSLRSRYPPGTQVQFGDLTYTV